MSKKKEIKKLKKEIKKLNKRLKQDDQEFLEYIGSKFAEYEMDIDNLERRVNLERDVRQTIIKTVNRHSERLAHMKNEEHFEEIKEPEKEVTL